MHLMAVGHNARCIYMTVSVESVPNGTFGILRNTILKQ